MRKLFSYFACAALMGSIACTNETAKVNGEQKEVVGVEQEAAFDYNLDQFGDLRVMRYQIPGFDELNLNQKELLFHLYNAAYSGRDIIWDQNCKYNLAVRRTLESIISDYQGDKSSADWNKFMDYTKRIWFSNGIHHHYSTDKIMPEFSEDYFKVLLKGITEDALPTRAGQAKAEFIAEITPVIFDPSIAPKRVNLDPNVDIIKQSATNYYDGVSQKEVEDFYKSKIDPNDPRPISYGLNSQLAKVDGKIVERKWTSDGMYGAAIKQIVAHLEKAQVLAESDAQAKSIEQLISFYQTGDLRTFDDYSITWVQDTTSAIDVVNGFIEVYGDPLGFRGAWQSVVSIKDFETSKTFGQIAGQAAYFEKNSSTAPEHKKEKITAVTYKVINVVAESGDCSPSTPIGVNLPNANWIRSNYGSKSVSLGNIEHAYDEASKGSGSLEEFFTPQQVESIRKYGTLAGKLHTGLHEVIGHGSGKLEAGVGTPKETLKNYSSTLEEARADLVALYFMFDNKLLELNLTDSKDVGKAAYDSYIVNGLMKQLSRLEPGKSLEESHMRNRQLIAKWVFEQGKEDNVIERKKIDGKTYFVVNDYEKLRVLFGDLLKEVQRIKSQGDFKAGQDLVENFGVQVEAELHGEVLERFAKLNQAPYGGFANPYLTPMKKEGVIVGMEISYPESFESQMLRYAKDFSFLPTYN